ncbi:PBP1 and LysM peptidoglycan-binding domain-containing protein [Polaribacter sp. DS7-9]|uniref:LysM peptidoglycan-binding domain-containing protein n=1 Tax=Polaribacter sargassicola TaxID=2836891 RepID=UPI001F3DAB0E
MKTTELMLLNPDVGRKPPVNTVIVIPNKKMVVTEQGNSINTEDNSIVVKDDTNNTESLNFKDGIIEENDKLFVGYQVKKGDTFYSLTRFYNVSKDEMIALNPELSEGLKTGQIIKIKDIEAGESLDKNIYEDVIEDSNSLKVALLLPFLANDYDSIESKDIFLKSKLANIVTDLYLGAEIAIDSLEKQGLNVELNVFDTERKNTKINSILSENILNDYDVIIGPLYSEEAEKVAANVKTPVIFPVYSKNQSNFKSSRLIKTAADKSIFRKGLIDYISESFTSGNLILVGDGSSASNMSSNVIKTSLEKHDSINYISVLKTRDGYIAKDRFLEVLKPNTNNWVVLTSDDEVLVADAINSLISLPDSTDVRVFAINKGKAFDKIDNKKLAKVHLTYASDEYVDESSKTTQLFNKQYYIKNNVLPSFYATKGFDITYDVLMRLASGNRLEATFKDGASYRVETKFDYDTKLFGSVDNNGLFIVQYKEDLSLVRLK